MERRPVLRRLLDETIAAREAGFGLARGLIAVALVLVVLLVALRYADRKSDGAAVTVKAPVFVSAPVAARPQPAAAAEPAQAPVDRPAAPFDPAGWYVRPSLDIRQEFSTTGRTGAEICAALARSGFPDAAWAPSAIFPGEWECSSQADAAGRAGSVFLVVRGRSEQTADGVMLKTNDASSSEAQAAFRALAMDVVSRFALASSGELAPEIASSFAAWAPGAFKQGGQTLRIITQHGQSAPSVVNFTAAPQLSRPMADPCGPDCFPLHPAIADGAKLVEATP